MRKCFSLSGKLSVFVWLAVITASWSLNAFALPRYKRHKKTDLLPDLSQPLNRCREYNLHAEDEPDKPVASDNNFHLTISTADGKLKLFETATARLLWTSDLGLKRINSNVVFDETAIYFTTITETAGGARNLTLKNINKLTGLANWQTKPAFLSDAPTGAPVEKVNLSIRGEEITAVGQNGILYVFNKTDGRKIRGGQIGIKQPAAVLYNFDDRLIVETPGSRLSVVSTGGTTLGEIPTEEKVSAALSSDSRLIFGDKRGNVFAVDSQNYSAAWKFRAGAGISDISETEYGVMITSDDNFVYLVTSAKGKLVWKRRMPGRVLGTLVAGSYAIAVSLAQPEADVIELSSGRIVNRLFADADNHLTGYVFVQNDLLILSTSKGLIAFSPGIC